LQPLSHWSNIYPEVSNCPNCNESALWIGATSTGWTGSIGLRLTVFFTIKRSWILHFGGVLSHGLPPNHPCSFRIVHYKLSMGSPIFTVKARGKHPRNRTFNGLRMAISRCPDFKT
jgi:hypothetical protein